MGAQKTDQMDLHHGMVIVESLSFISVLETQTQGMTKPIYNLSELGDFRPYVILDMHFPNLLHLKCYFKHNYNMISSELFVTQLSNYFLLKIS